MVPPRRSRSSRPPSVSSGRLLPPRLSALPAAVLVAVLTLTCAVLGAGPAAAQPAIPVPPPGDGAVSVPLPVVPAPADAIPAVPPAPHRPRATPPRRRPRLRRRTRAPPRRRRTPRAPPPSCGRCSRRPRHSPSSGTPRRTTSPRGARRWTRLRGAIDPARAAADAARGDEEHYREQVDTVALSTFESGRLDAFNALLASRTPQDYLDQMSALEMVAAQHASALDQLTAVVDRTRHAQDDADAAAARAQVAADEAARAEQELAARKRDADRRIDEAEALLRRLTPRALQDYLGPNVAAPALPSRHRRRRPRPARGRRPARQGLPVGRGGAAQLRLLGPDLVLLPPGRHHAPAVQLPAGAGRASGGVGRPAARRPRVLPQPRQPRGHLRRWREDDPRTADRRRGALLDRQPEHVQRRPPLVDPRASSAPLWRAAAAPVGSAAARHSCQSSHGGCAGAAPGRRSPPVASRAWRAPCW